MRYLAPLLTTFILASGCTLVFDGRNPGDDVCAVGAPEIAVAPQRNPETLECQGFGFPCDPACGPCPLSDQPVPTWGFCGSTCEGLTESACAAASECRVVKDIQCANTPGCTAAFIMCLPLDQVVDPTVDCLAARDGTTCSKSPSCTAYHYRKLTGVRGATNILAFATCVPEGQGPSTCYSQITCARPRPACSSLEMPEIRNNCYTGRCLPAGACEPPPPPV